MIDIPFDPNLVIGSVRISWHSLFAFVGMVVGSLAPQRLKNRHEGVRHPIAGSLNA